MQVLRFGTFELDLANGELRKAGVLLKLSPQPFQVLRLLAEGEGQLRTRDEIRQAIWGDNTHVDFDRNLNVCMTQIRAVLGDEADTPRFIETVPRRGYRFVAPVQKLGPLPEPAPAIEPPIPAKSAWRGPAAAVTGLIAIFAVWRLVAPPAPAQRLLIAALPFQDLSGDPRSGPFLDGLLEEMIESFGALQPGRMSVIARTSVTRFQHSGRGVDQLGRELGAGYVVEGAIRWAGDRVRVAARLIQTRDQAQVASATEEYDASDAFAAQQRIAARLTAQFAKALFGTGAVPTPSNRRAASATEAYRNGRLAQRVGTQAALEQSIQYFRAAVQADAQFAEAWSALASSHVKLGLSGGDPSETFPKAREAAEKALAANDRLPEAHDALADALFWYDWKWEEAERHFRRATELNPSFAQAHHDYAFFRVAMGRKEDALASLRQAIALDPLSPDVNLDAGWLLLQAHRYQEAAAQATRSLQLEPQMAAAHSCLLRAAAARRDYQAMLQELKRLGAPAPLREGEAGVRDYYSERVAKMRDPFTAAIWYAFLGQREGALDALDRALARHSASLVMLRTEPAFLPLHGDARFETLAKRVGLPPG